MYKINTHTIISYTNFHKIISYQHINYTILLLSLQIIFSSLSKTTYLLNIFTYFYKSQYNHLITAFEYIDKDVINI